MFHFHDYGRKGICHCCSFKNFFATWPGRNAFSILKGFLGTIATILKIPDYIVVLRFLPSKTFSTLHQGIGKLLIAEMVPQSLNLAFLKRVSATCVAWLIGHGLIFFQVWRYIVFFFGGTVDGWNPAPVDRFDRSFIPLCKGFYTSLVVSRISSISRAAKFPKLSLIFRNSSCMWFWRPFLVDRDHQLPVWKLKPGEVFDTFSVAVVEICQPINSWVGRCFILNPAEFLGKTCRWNQQS